MASPFGKSPPVVHRAYVRMVSRQLPSLLVRGRWIPVDHSQQGTKSALVELIVTESGAIFSCHYLARFHLTLGHPMEEIVNVDLALISRDYQSWCLLFVAPAKDANLSSLLHRVETASLSTCGTREALYLEKQMVGVDREKLHQLVLAEAPELIVVTDDPHHGWSAQMKKFDVKIMVVEPFRDGDDYIIRINGEYPSERRTERLATCESHPVLVNALLVRGILPNAAHPPGLTRINYRNQATDWTLVNGDQVLLIPQGSYPLLEDPPFEIVEEGDGTLSIRPIAT